MGWFKQQEKKININTKQAIKRRANVSRIEEEGEVVTIGIDRNIMPEITFVDQQIVVKDEEEDDSTSYSGNIPQ
jgi:hypothetical protein